MNKDRRARLHTIRIQLTALSEEIEAIRDEEQDALDNMPAPFQDATPGALAQEVIDSLETTLDNLNDVSHQLEELSSG